MDTTMPSLAQPADGLVCTGQLGREGHHRRSTLDHAGRQQCVEVRVGRRVHESEGRGRRPGRGERNGPSRWTPSGRAEPAAATSSGNAAAACFMPTSSRSTGAVMKVGWNAVTPVSGSRQATASHSSGRRPRSRRRT